MYPFEEWLDEAPAFCRSNGRPLVGLCYAQSLDGSLSYQPGRPLALSGRQSSRLTHHLRSRHDGILVGIGTVLADDPELTVRLVTGRDPQPVILDSKLRTPLNARLLGGDREAPKPWLAVVGPADPTRRRAIEAAGGRVLEFPPAATGGVDLAGLVCLLAELGIQSLMIEGGGRVISSFLAQGLADFAVITIAPYFVAGVNLPGAMGAVEPVTVSQFPHLVEGGCETLGEDLLVWGRLERPLRESVTD